VTDRPRRRRRVAATAVAATVALAAAGCTQNEAPPAQAGEKQVRPTRPGPTVLQPGRPGEPARTLGPDATVSEAQPNAADADFVQMMIPHHAQALRMCDLARTRARDEQVAAVARRIDAAQGPEILAMSAWLQAHGLPVPSRQGGQQDGGHAQGGHEHGGHGSPGGGSPAMASMPGMLSAEQMRELAGTSGRRFDRLFLAGMIRHHRGAVQMAQSVLNQGSDLRVSEMATDVAAEQKAEIARMRAILRNL
jgi:uncharacterized protein (DUF305 family)